MHILAAGYWNFLVPLIAIVFFLVALISLIVLSGTLKEPQGDPTERQEHDQRVVNRLRGSLLAMFILWIVLVILTYALTSILSAFATAVGCVLPVCLIMLVA